MDLDALQKRLLAAARADHPGDSVPFAFERRIMARLTEAPVADAWTLWNRVLWRVAVPCVALTLLLGVWSCFSDGDTGSPDTLGADLESAVYAPLDNPEDVW